MYIARYARTGGFMKVLEKGEEWYIFKFEMLNKKEVLLNFTNY